MKIQSSIITSRQNPVLKWVCTLHDKKGRAQNKCFIAEGEKLSFEAASELLPVKCIFICETKKDKLLPKIKDNFCNEIYSETDIYIVADAAFEKITTEKAPQGIITIIKYLDFFKELDIIYNEDFFLSANERAIALCSLRDPGNLGAVIRSAVAFGVEHIIMTADCADFCSPKVVRSAMGSLFKVKLTVVSDFLSFVRAARANGRRVFSAELSDKSVSLEKIDIRANDIFIIGNEGHGVDKDISAASDLGVFIPISNRIESLNASVAASILIWEQGKIK
jgi:TrmH family RNA methyltransferase